MYRYRDIYKDRQMDVHIYFGIKKQIHTHNYMFVYKTHFKQTHPDQKVCNSRETFNWSDF